MTHQEIAAEIEALSNATTERRKVIDADHRAQMLPIRERCGTVGHIFVLSMTVSIFGQDPQDSYACAICGARRSKLE